MLSNKLTFSLASCLIVMLVLAFTATQATAQVAVPTGLTEAADLAGDAATPFIVVAPTRPNATNQGGEFLSSVPGDLVATASWEDLNDFFLFGGGGTIDLVAVVTDGDSNVANDPTLMQNSFIISEIQWGGAVEQQWIEIYVPEEITLGSDTIALHLVFTEAGLSAGAIGDRGTVDATANTFTLDAADADPVGTAMIVDKFSNWGFGQWVIEDDGPYGQSGVVPAAATATAPAVAAKTFISMQRKIDYAKTEADDWNGTDGVPDGSLSGSWEKSKPPRTGLMGARIGSPGMKPTTPITAGNKSTISRAKFKINEVGNNGSYDWVEIVNVTDAKQEIKKMELSIVKPDQTDTSLVKFPDDGKFALEAGEILVVTTSDPDMEGHPLALGRNINDSLELREQDPNGVSPMSLYYVASSLVLPDDGNFLLILRDESKLGKAEKFHDVAGALAITVQDADFNTGIWPLQATPKPHGDVFKDALAEMFADGKVYIRKNDNSFAEHAWESQGYTGIGYKRTASSGAKHGGTPGYPNGALKEKAFTATDAVTISEVMVNSSNGRQPQWIELRNMSKTEGVNLDNWKLRIENVGEVDARSNATVDLPNGFRIPPNDTILIATRSSGRSAKLTDTRVIVLWSDADARDDLEVDNPRFTMLSTEGFTLKLFEKDQKVDKDTPVDMVTATADQLTEDAIGTHRERISLVRAYMSGVKGDLFSARDSEQVIRIPNVAYYGNSTDIGTPGWYTGSALPVSLSSFRPARDKATGEVVIRWITQSELNNAGFNILRSETKTGEFKVVNLKGIIPGHGTTSEKHVYEWTDTSAKPNVVYYYQIEDVSLDGNRTTLRTTHLRGNVNAAGKLTTTWGDLKTQN